MEEQAVVRIDTKLANEVRIFSRITGISITTVLNQAVAEWIELGRLIGPLEEMRKKVTARIEKSGSKVRLSDGERELLARYQPQNDPEPDELDKDGKPMLVFHLYDDEPVPREWWTKQVETKQPKKKRSSAEGDKPRVGFQREVKW